MIWFQYPKIYNQSIDYEYDYYSDWNILFDFTNDCLESQQTPMTGQHHYGHRRQSLNNDQQHQQSLNEEQQSISDYYERMNPNVIRSHSNSSAPIVLDSYYDDSNVRPSYLAMRRKV